MSNYGVMSYTLDQESLKQFGISEKLEPLFDNVFKGANGRIYAACGETIRLLARNSTACPIVLGKAELPDDVAEIQSKIYAPSSDGANLRMYVDILNVQWKGTDFAFVTENICTHEQKVFAKYETDYKEIPDWDVINIGGRAKALVVGGVLLIAEKKQYEIIDFIPFFEASTDSTIFWAGDKELLEACFEAEKLKFRYFGCIKKFTQTAVSNLIEIKEDEEKYALYHLGKGLHFLSYSPFENDFKIDKTTGTVVVHAAICSCGVQEITRTFVYKDERYEKQV